MPLDEPGDTRRTVEIAAGMSLRRDAGGNHNVINGGAAPMSFVGVELN